MLKKTLLILLTLSVLNLKAQNTSSTKTTLNESMVVRGDDGMVYPYKTWKNLMLTGKYAIKKRGTFTDSGTPEYLIYQLSEAEQEAHFNRIAKPRASDSFKEGEEFKGFKATDINGKKFDLREAKGKVIVLNFWFINCPPCKQEIPQLNELVAAFKDNPNVVFLAIALDDRFAMREFIKTSPFNYNLVEGRPIAAKYGVKGYPTHVVIDTAGKIKFSTLGLASNTIHWIKKSINESLASN